MLKIYAKNEKLVLENALGSNLEFVLPDKKYQTVLLKLTQIPKNIRIEKKASNNSILFLDDSKMLIPDIICFALFNRMQMLNPALSFPISNTEEEI